MNKTKKKKREYKKPESLDKSEREARLKNTHDYKATGRVNHKGDWRDISVVVMNVANERVARSRAAEHMHIIKRVERV